MKKQVVIIGIVALLISIGLSGCTEQTSNGQSSQITSIGTINAHANNYINNTVKVKATYIGGGGAAYYMIIDSSSMYVIESTNVVKPTPVVSGSIYKFTGIVRYGRLPGSFFSDIVYLEVTKIETT